MKAILEFDMPEESTEFQLAQDGCAWMGVVHDMDNYLRGIIKYQDKQDVKAEEVRAKLYEFTEDHNVRLK